MSNVVSLLQCKNGISRDLAVAPVENRQICCGFIAHAPLNNHFVFHRGVTN